MSEDVDDVAPDEGAEDEESQAARERAERYLFVYWARYPVGLSSVLLAVQGFLRTESGSASEALSDREKMRYRFAAGAALGLHALAGFLMSQSTLTPGALGVALLGCAVWIAFLPQRSGPFDSYAVNVLALGFAALLCFLSPAAARPPRER